MDLSAVPGTAQAGRIERMKTKKRDKTSNGSESIHHRSRNIIRNKGDESH